VLNLFRRKMKMKSTGNDVVANKSFTPSFALVLNTCTCTLSSFDDARSSKDEGVHGRIFQREGVTMYKKKEERNRNRKQNKGDGRGGGQGGEEKDRREGGGGEKEEMRKSERRRNHSCGAKGTGQTPSRLFL
jgi:hypothetical protein